MLPITEKERLKITDFFFKRKSLYSVIGWIFSLSLLSNLAVITLPEVLNPDYPALKEEYGSLFTIGVAYFVGKIFGVISAFVVFSKIIVIWMCFHYEAKLKAAGKSGLTIKNIIVGFRNTVTNNITITKDDEHS